MVIVGIGQTRGNRQEVIEICNHGVFKGSFHAGAREICARRGIGEAPAGQNFLDSCFGLIQDKARPAETKKVHLGQERSTFLLSAPESEHASTNAVKRFANKRTGAPPLLG